MGATLIYPGVLESEVLAPGGTDYAATDLPILNDGHELFRLGIVINVNHDSIFPQHTAKFRQVPNFGIGPEGIQTFIFFNGFLALCGNKSLV